MTLTADKRTEIRAARDQHARDRILSHPTGEGKPRRILFLPNCLAERCYDAAQGDGLHALDLAIRYVRHAQPR